MADYRSVQTRMWREDEWFDSLDTEARLLWIYLFTNPSSSPAGIYRLTMRTMSNESRIPFDRTCELMECFAADKKAYYNGGVVWVVNMRRLQFPDLDGSGAWQVGKKMQDDIDAIPDTNPLKGEYLKRNGYPIIEINDVNGKQVKTVRIEYGYPINTQSVNSNITVTVTETVTETEVAPSGAAPAPDPVPEPVVEPEPAPEPKPKKPRAVPEGGQSDMFGAIAEACQLDAKIKAGHIARTAKALLGAGYTPAQVRAFPVWWQVHDWRGQRGDVPTLAQLTEKIKQSTNGAAPPLPPRNGNGNWQTLGERQSADYQRKMAALLGD